MSIFIFQTKIRNEIQKITYEGRMFIVHVNANDVSGHLLSCNNHFINQMIMFLFILEEELNGIQMSENFYLSIPLAMCC